MSINTSSASPGPEPFNATGPLEASPPQETANPYARLVIWLGLAFLLRLFLIHFPYMFKLDVDTFRSWTDTIIRVGPANFYGNTWSDYPPLFMYFLWIWGLIQQVFTHTSVPSATWIKLPSAMIDIVNSLLIFQLLKGRVAIRSAFRTAVFYAFNPVVLFVSAVWGQVDAVITMMMLLIALATVANRLFPAAALSAAAILVKPQGLFMVPVVFFAQWFKQPAWKWPLAILTGVGTMWLILLPACWNKLSGFTPVLGGLSIPMGLAEPFYWFAHQMQQTGNNYPYSTVNAFNIWLLPPPNETWKSDSRTLFFLTHYTWGMILIGICLALVAWYLWKNRHVNSIFPFFLGAAVTLTGFYMLPTRMHERYVFPAIAFLALAQACNRRLSWLYWGFSFTSFLTITYVFFFYNDTSAWVEGLKNMMGNGPMLGSLKLSGQVLIALVNVWLFGELLSFLFVKGEMVPEIAENRLVTQFRWLKAAVIEQPLSWLDAAIPAVMGAVMMVWGTWDLGTPNEQIFDEVYHARTAMEYIAGINPYEWTHPPLAKLLASCGILVFGQEFSLQAKTWTVAQAFAWRFPAVVFGALTLVFTYMLARSMFRNRVIATAAMCMLFCDGVFFVQSRVAMTNIYEVCFIMLGTLGTWKYLQTNRDKWLWLMAFGLGCALSCRWSTLYAWGLTGLILLWHAWATKLPEWQMLPAEGTTGTDRLKSALERTHWGPVVGWLAKVVGAMLVVPGLIYLLTYIPFVLQGGGAWQLHLFSWNLSDHGWGKVITMQRDMWNYHAHLEATHPYSSPWWSWPIMLRPTWYYFHDWKNGTLSGVWAIGNAFVWWATVPALGYAAFLAWRDKLRSLALLSTLGFGLWVMWGVQPRPLLYMHYMFETIPFACIALAYIGYQFWHANQTQLPGTDGLPAPAGEAEPAPLPPLVLRGIVLVYAVLIVGWYALYFPLLSAHAIPWWFYNWHLWYGRAWI